MILVADTEWRPGPGNQQVLLTIRTVRRPATDFRFLRHNHPEHAHTREFAFGNGTVFYPEASEEVCTAAVLLDVDPVGIVRGRGGKGGAEDQPVNDRRYLASALLSVVPPRPGSSFVDPEGGLLTAAPYQIVDLADPVSEASATA